MTDLDYGWLAHILVIFVLVNNIKPVFLVITDLDNS